MERYRSGATLMEVLATCSILAILGTSAVFYFGSSLPSYRLKAAARELYTNMHLIKMKAIKDNAQYTITYNTAANQYHISGVTKTVSLGDYGYGIRFLGPQGQTVAVNTISFNSRGTSNAGYAYLTDGKNTAYYKVGPLTTGNIRLLKHVSGENWE